MRQRVGPLRKSTKQTNKLTKRQREKFNKIRNEKEDITTDMEYRESSGHISKTCTPQYWKT